MKDFIKWLGVNEKVAKVAVWMLIIMVFLIVTNTMLESVGFPHYAITYDNLVKINPSRILEYLINWISILLNFYAIIFLVFSIRDYTKIYKYSILYLILNIIINNIAGKGILEIFILLFVTTFGYFYSNKNRKYILYMIGSLVLNTLIQWVTYLYKAQFIDYSNIDYVTKTILFSDYFIIMAIIILVKEIYLKKRGAVNWEIAGSGLENSKKKANSLKKSQKKQAA